MRGDAARRRGRRLSRGATRRLGASLLLPLAWGCAGEPAPELRPSLLLVVIDTLRADAVSAYGAVEGTTPRLDALAHDGILYRHAFAPAPWTLPSHASLLSGLPPDRHGVGVAGSMVLRDSVSTVAERLRSAGFRTGAFSENPLVGPEFGMAQGFEHFAVTSMEEMAAQALGAAGTHFDSVAALRRWLGTLADGKPLFVFVNLFDPHDPYEIRDQNPFVPAEATRRDLESAAESTRAICDALPGQKELTLLRGLYHGDVAVADRKLGAIVEMVRNAVPEGSLVTVVTSDHGEHLGEHRLMGHEFSVRNAALHVPLVVQGVASSGPGVVETPVTLTDVAGSLLDWAGVRQEGDPVPLPLSDGESVPERPLFAFYSDAPLRGPGNLPEGMALDSEVRDVRRSDCRHEDRVHGDLHAVLRFPLKLVSFPDHPPELYDLSWDSQERSDIASHRPEMVSELAESLDDWTKHLALSGAGPALSPEGEAALRALGYVE